MSCNNLEVDVNGQETFSVSMEILASFSGKLRKIFCNNKPASKAAENARILKVIISDFPGGAEGFELIVRFCYNGGSIEITPCNVFLLHSSAKYLEIQENLTKKYLESVRFWTWSEILDGLNHCQELSIMNVSLYLVQELIDALVEKLSTINIYSSYSFSFSDNSSIQFSCDISSSTNSRRSSSFRTSNDYWLRDLEFLSVGLFEKVLSTMIISKKLDRWMMCSFLVHYQKAKLFGFLTDYEKCDIIEVVIKTLTTSLDRISIVSFYDLPFRSLCDILRLCHTLRMGKFWVEKVERMIGLRLVEATLDDLMIPSRRNCDAYDADLILRFLKIFIGERGKNNVRCLRKIGFLMDLYLAEVAPDPQLKPCKFLALVMCLPSSARETYNRVFEAIDIYFEVHKLLSESEKIKIWSSLDCDENCKKMVKISANVGRTNIVTCPANGKSLPRLCS